MQQGKVRANVLFDIKRVGSIANVGFEKQNSKSKKVEVQSLKKMQEL